MLSLKYGKIDVREPNYLNKINISRNIHLKAAAIACDFT
jgi:hypothetical protein